MKVSLAPLHMRLQEEQEEKNWKCKGGKRKSVERHASSNKEPETWRTKYPGWRSGLEEKKVPSRRLAPAWKISKRWKTKIYRDQLWGKWKKDEEERTKTCQDRYREGQCPKFKILGPECEGYFKNWRDCQAHCLAKKHASAKDGQWLQHCKIRHHPKSCKSAQEKANVMDRSSSDRKFNPDTAEENTYQHIDGEAPPPAPSIWVRKDIFKSDVLHYNSNLIVSSGNFDFESQ